MILFSCIDSLKRQVFSVKVEINYLQIDAILICHETAVFAKRIARREENKHQGGGKTTPTVRREAPRDDTTSIH